MPAVNNPYIIDGPVSENSGFFGRQALVQAITEILRYPPNTSVIVYGQRKIGKSSLLRHLERTMKPPFFPVYFDLAGKGMDSISQVLYEMAVAAANNAGIQPPPAADFEDNPDAFHSHFLPALYQALGHQQQPTFLLDEFDAIDIPETELPENAAARNLDTYLYQLLTTQSHTDFIFAAGRRMNELNSVQSSGYQADLTQFLSVLPPPQTRDLILQPGAPQYKDDALAYIIDATRGHPYLTQLLCHTVFEQTQQPGSVITVKDVKAAQGTLLNGHNNSIAHIWESIPNAEQLTLAAAAEAVATPGAVIPLAVLENSLIRADVPVSLPQIQRAPQNLVNWQMLEQTGGGYAFYIDLQRRWVAANRPLEQVKAAELSGLARKPNQLYQLALLDYRRNKTAEALSKLYEALAITPNHLPALMLKGEILVAKNYPAEAVVAYDQAYQLNPLLSAAPLAASLALLGQQQEAAGNPTAALESYQRALRIDPKNETAATREAALQARVTPATVQKTPAVHRNWWPLAAAAGLLLLLLLGWLYGSGLIGQPPAVATSSEVTDNAATSAAESAAATSLAKNDAATTSAENAAATSAANNAAATASAENAIATAVAENSAATTAKENDAATAIAENAVATAVAAENAEATATAVAEAQSNPPVSGVINISGSAALNPLFQALAAEFSANNPNVQLNISGSNSQTGLDSVLNGSSDIAMLGRDLSPAELSALNGGQLFTLPQADHVALVVHPLTPVADLSAAQLRDIFTGNITNWQEVGGPDAPIVRVLPGADSDTRQAFQQQMIGPDATINEDGAVLVANDNEVLAAVTRQPNAIGFTAVPASPQAQNQLAALAQTENWAVVDTSLMAAKSLTVDQAVPGSDAYPLRRPINLVTGANLSPATQAWIDFIYSPAGQRVIEQFRRADNGAQ